MIGYAMRPGKTFWRVMGDDVIIRPAVGESLFGQGQVIVNKKVVDVTGKWHGLMRLEVQGSDWPEIDVWCGVLPAGARVFYAWRDTQHPGRIIVLYKM